MDYKTEQNPGAMAGGGAGIHAAQFVADKGATAILTGHVGPNAYRALATGGVTIYTGISGTVKDAIVQYKAGKLKPATSATAPAHTGMGAGRGPGMGRGRGRRRT